MRAATVTGQTYSEGDSRVGVPFRIMSRARLEASLMTSVLFQRPSIVEILIEEVLGPVRSAIYIRELHKAAERIALGRTMHVCVSAAGMCKSADACAFKSVQRPPVCGLRGIP